MRIAVLLSLLLLAAAAPSRVQAQEVAADTVQTVTQIETRDGTRYLGVVTREDGDTLILTTLSGVVVEIPVSEIVSRSLVEGRARDGEFRRFDPNTTRLLFSSTGRSLRKGQGYFANYYIIFGMVAYAPTDRVTIGGGSFLIPSLAKEFMYVTPKVSLHSGEKDNVAMGALIGFAGGGTGGLLYGVYTRGTPDRALTVGLGTAFAEGEFESNPLMVIGGEARVSRRIKLVTENYLLPTMDSGALLSGAIRFFGDRLAADLGWVSVLSSDGDTTPLFPLVNFTWNFGQGR